MSVKVETQPPPGIPPEHYINTDYGWKSWLSTLDHKRIAILYLVSVTLMFFLGGLGALIVRLNLLSPQGGPTVLMAEIPCAS